MDSNGNETGIAVEEGNVFTRAMRMAFGSTHSHVSNSSLGGKQADFDDDDDDDGDGVSDFRAPEGDASTGGFVVNRPRPLRVLNEDNTNNRGGEDSSVGEGHF